MLCRCGSDKVVKNGKRSGKQCFLCRLCRRQFSDDGAITDVEKRAAVTLYAIGLSFRKIGVLLRYSHVTILNWVREFDSELEGGRWRIEDEGELGDFKLMELDELWIFLDTRKSYSRPGKRFTTIDEAVMWSAEREIEKMIENGFVND